MPDIGHITGEQRPSFAPVGPIVIQHLAGALGLRRTRLVAPGRIVFHPIGRVGHHQERIQVTKKPPDNIGRGAVAADQPVRSQLPEIACHRHRCDRRFGDLILALDRAIGAQRVRVTQKSIQIFVTHAEEGEVEVFGQEPRDLVAQHGLVPFAEFRKLVVDDPVGPSLRLVEVAEPDHRYILQTQHGGGQHPAVAGNQFAIVCDHAGNGPAEFRHAGGDFRHLIRAVDLGVLRIGP